MVDSMVCEVQCYVFDRLFGGLRQAGNHLYRTEHIQPLSLIVGSLYAVVRPEVSLPEEAKHRGLRWSALRICVGLHDFFSAALIYFAKHFFIHKSTLIWFIIFKDSGVKLR